MFRSASVRNWFGVVAVAAIAAGTPHLSAARDQHKFSSAQDIFFGEALYRLNQQEFFSAITILEVARHTRRLKHHADEAEVLLAGMYLSYGMHRAAAARLERIVREGVPPEISDRAWFYLGKVRYQRGYLPEAEAALRKVRDRLPVELEEEKNVLLANVLMARQQYDEAIRVLDRLRGRTPWTTYGRYNLGVALVKAGRREDGVRLLEKVGGFKAREEELKALRDKANLALGYLHLQSRQPRRARAYLEKVRLDGMLSNKALLGVGWAYSALGRQKKALVFWTELQKRDVIDPAVQESLLAVPYALGELKAYDQAIRQYREAIAIYETEIERLGHAARALRDGRLVEQLLRQGAGRERGWFWALKRLPDSPESRYLVHLLSGHPFQEALKSYQDLQFLRDNIRRRLADTYSFDEVVDTRKATFRRRLPVVRKKYNALNIAAVRKERDRLAAKLARAEKNDDVFVLARAREQALLDKVALLEREVARLPADRRGDLQAKLRLVRGTVLWRLTTDYPARLWLLKTGIRELDAAIAETNRGADALYRIQRDVPRQLDDYQKRLAGFRQRLRRLETDTGRMEIALRNYLQDLAVQGLRQQQQRLDTYLTQARFGIAQVLDKAVKQSEGAAP